MAPRLVLLEVGRPTGVFSWTLRQHNQQRDDDGRNDRGGQRAAEIQAAVADRLIEKVAHGGAERPGQDERKPE